jgi:Ca2+-binding EF-hand superfamily protein
MHLNYDEIRKIRNKHNQAIFKQYLNEIFYDILKRSDTLISKTISKIMFTNYLKRLPFLVSSKIYELFKSEGGMTREDFVEGVNIIYNGLPHEVEEFVFSLLDSDYDGAIKPEDCTRMLKLIAPVINNTTGLVKKFFEASSEMSLREFSSAIEVNADIFLTLLNFFYKNAPFDELSLSTFRLDNSIIRNYYSSTNSLSYEKKTCKVYLTRLLTKADFKVGESIEDSFEENDVSTSYESDDSQLLDELSGSHIVVPSIDVKTLNNIQNKYNSKEKNKNENSPVVKEGMIYKFNNDANSLIKKMRWLVLVNHDLFYFSDSYKSHLKYFHNLTDCFVYDETVKKSFDGVTYHGFQIKFGDIVKEFYCKEVGECLQWINKLKDALGQRNIYESYQMIKHIGDGGYASVFLAKDLNTNGLVAIKIFDKQMTMKDYLSLVRTEIGLLKYCHHDNIVKYIDSFEDTTNIYLVEEYMEAGTLTQLIARTPNMDEKFIKNIIKQIGRGLEYLHSNWIIHRDIKPDNILLKLNGSEISVKIADFGLSTMTTGNITSYPLGTLHYMSPEMIEGCQYSNKIDIWALGTILYYMLFRSLPLKYRFNNTAYTIDYNSANDKFLIPTSRNISSSAFTLLSCCIEKQQKKRINIHDFNSHSWFADQQYTN